MHQKSVLHVQSCCFAITKLIVFFEDVLIAVAVVIA